MYKSSLNINIDDLRDLYDLIKYNSDGFHFEYDENANTEAIFKDKNNKEVARVKILGRVYNNYNKKG
jgi:hypothetical protein